MTKDLSKEDIDIAILRALIDIHMILSTMAEFQEQLGKAVELLADQMGYEFSIKEDATA